MRQIVAVIGEMYAGKDEVTNILLSLLPSDQVAHIRFSHVIAEFAETFGLIRPGEQNRQLFQDIPPKLYKSLHPSVLANSVRHRIDQHQRGVVIVNGARWPADECMLKKVGAVFLYVTAGLEIRHGRCRESEKEDDRHLTLAEFRARHEPANEQYIPVMGRQALHQIRNESTKAHLRKEVRHFADCELARFRA